MKTDTQEPEPTLCPQCWNRGRALWQSACLCNGGAASSTQLAEYFYTQRAKVADAAPTKKLETKKKAK